MSGYIGSQPVPQATQTRQTFTATSGQTSFATIGYVAGGQFIQVYLNGVLLKLTDDYTAANGSDIVLTSGAATGDILEFISFADFTVNNQNFTGGLTVDNDGSTVLTVDRATSDGAIIDLKKSGSSVGNIGVNGRLTIDGASDGVGLYFGGSALLPREGGSITDGTVGLGGSTQRFTDLYLSGGVYLGGTGSDNKISDYETGTYTPSVVSGTVSTARGSYVKVGDLVTVTGTIGGFSDTTTANDIQCSVPFTSADGDRFQAHGSVMSQRINFGTSFLTAYLNDNYNYLRFYINSPTSIYEAADHNDVTGSSAFIRFTITYRVA